MSVKSTYNGWTNYETWLAGLWLNENERSYRFLMSVKDIDDDVYRQAEWLGEQMRMQLDQEVTVPCLWSDLLNAAFSQINWREIVESL